jgi:hypothetical protein
VVIHNFDFTRFVVVPDEAQAALFVDADRVLPGTFLPESLEGISRGAKILQTSGLVQLDELSERCLFDRLESAAVLPLEDCFRFRAPKRADHNFTVYR